MPPSRVKPTVDDADAVARLCDYLVTGMSMTKACAHEDVPVRSDVYKRMAKDETFATTIARARIAQQEALIDETQDMADQATAEDWQVVRLRIWARQWTAAKRAPRLYGDKIQHTGAGADGAILTRVERVILDPKD